jgi:hypothetical protein
MLRFVAVPIDDIFRRFPPLSWPCLRALGRISMEGEIIKFFIIIIFFGGGGGVGWAVCLLYCVNNTGSKKTYTEKLSFYPHRYYAVKVLGIISSKKLLRGISGKVVENYQ